MKTRTLAPIDYGCAGETSARYTTSGLTRWQSATTNLNGEAYLRESDAGAITNTQWSMPSPACMQSFDSTRRRRPVPNDVTNIKKFYKSWYYLTGYTYIMGNPVSSRYLYAQRRMRQPHFNVAQPAVPYQHFDSLVSSNLRAEAYWTMRPKFEGEISMINSLYELKDFKDILKLLNPKNLERSIELINRGLAKRPLNSSADIAANAYLFNSFAVQPLIADISSAIEQAQKTVLEHQKAFDVEENKRYFTHSIDPVVSLIVGTSNSTENVYRGTRTSRLFTATMEYEQRYKPRKAFDAFVTYWGLNPVSTEAIWNGLPFSFLIDYVFSIGKSLSLMRRDPNIDISARYYTESLLQETQAGYFIGPGVNQNLGILVCDTKRLRYTPPKELANRYEHVTGYSSSHYTRRLTDPYWGPVLPRIKVPSTKQGLNMLALLKVLL